MSLSAADASRPMRDADAALAGIIRRRLENALEIAIGRVPAP